MMTTPAVKAESAQRALLFVVLFFASTETTGSPLCAGIYHTLAIRHAQAKEPPRAEIVKEKEDGTRIVKVTEADGKVQYYKEDPAAMGKTVSFERQVFDSAAMSELAHRLAVSGGLDGVVPAAKYHTTGLEVNLNGKLTRLAPGVLQDGIPSLRTPFDTWRARRKKLHPEEEPREPTVREIQDELNRPEWAGEYADWKIFWNLFLQADMNIANLAVGADGKLRLFDVNDILNTPAVRDRMGVPNGGGMFNWPNKPGIRQEHLPDYNRASPPFKALVRAIASENAEATARRMGLSLNDDLPEPRGKVGDAVAAIKREARRIESQFK